MDKKSIILTGATGLVGSRFVELYSEVYDISNLDLATGVDITDLAQVKAFIESHPADTLIHLAAFTDTTRAQVEAGDKNGICYKVNVLGTENIAKVCSELGVHLIHISTDFVFDGTKATPYLEADTPNPLDWYGQTKAMAENVVLESSGTHTILRISYPYRANFALKPDIIAKIKTGLESNTLSPQFSDSTITPTFVDDIVRGFVKVAEVKPAGIYHLVGSSSHSPYELAREVAATYGFDPNMVKEGSLTEYLKSSPRPFARHLRVSNAKAVNELDLTFVDLKTGLASIKKQQL